MTLSRCRWKTMQTGSHQQSDDPNPNPSSAKPSASSLHVKPISCSSDQQLVSRHPHINGSYITNACFWELNYDQRVHFRVSWRCNTAHHAEDTSAGPFGLLPCAVWALSPSVTSPSVKSFSPLSHPSRTGPLQGLIPRDRCGDGGESRNSST